MSSDDPRRRPSPIAAPSRPPPPPCACAGRPRHDPPRPDTPLPQGESRGPDRSPRPGVDRLDRVRHGPPPARAQSWFLMAGGPCLSVVSRRARSLLADQAGWSGVSLTRRCPPVEVGHGPEHAWADHRSVGDQIAGHLDHRGPGQHGVLFQRLCRLVQRGATQVGQHPLSFAQVSFDLQPVPVSLGPRQGSPSGSLPHPARGMSPAGSGPTPPRLPSSRSEVHIGLGRASTSALTAGRTRLHPAPVRSVRAYPSRPGTDGAGGSRSAGRVEPSPGGGFSQTSVQNSIARRSKRRPRAQVIHWAWWPWSAAAGSCYRPMTGGSLPGPGRASVGVPTAARRGFLRSAPRSPGPARTFFLPQCVPTPRASCSSEGTDDFGRRSGVAGGSAVTREPPQGRAVHGSGT